MCGAVWFKVVSVNTHRQRVRHWSLAQCISSRLSIGLINLCHHFVVLHRRPLLHVRLGANVFIPFSYLCVIAIGVNSSSSDRALWPSICSHWHKQTDVVVCCLQQRRCVRQLSGQMFGGLQPSHVMTGLTLAPTDTPLIGSPYTHSIGRRCANG